MAEQNKSKNDTEYKNLESKYNETLRYIKKLNDLVLYIISLNGNLPEISNNLKSAETFFKNGGYIVDNEILGGELLNDTYTSIDSIKKSLDSLINTIESEIAKQYQYKSNYSYQMSAYLNS